MKRLFFGILVFILIIQAQAYPQDSIYVKQFDKKRYFNSDSIFINYTQKGFLFVIDDLYDYYEDIVEYLPIESRRKEVWKMRQIAKEYNSPGLNFEADFMHALTLPEDSEKGLSLRTEVLQQVADEAGDRGDTVLRLRALEAIFDTYWDTSQYAKAIRQAHIIDRELQDVTDDQYPGKGNAYYQIAKAFYFFKDYSKAVPYLRKAMKPAKYYFDRTNLRAKNAIGKYHNLMGNVDSAEYYFRSAFFSRENVKSRSLFDAIALSNIGQSLYLKQEYDSAISYLDAGMKKMLQDNHYEFSAEAAIGLAKCYLAKGDLRKTKSLIDSSQLFIRRSSNTDLYQTLYPLMCNYYAKTGNSALQAAYLDSTLQINKIQTDKYNGIYLLRAEQELFESEKRAKDEEIKLKEENYRNKQLYGLAAILLMSAGLIIFMVLYRKNKKAYRALVHKNQEWASTGLYEEPETPPQEVESSHEELNEPNEEVVDAGPTEEDRLVMKKVYEVVVKEKVYKDLDLSLDSLSKKMDVNRNYLSKAINRTTGKNFNTYINEYRVKEAINILSSEKSDVISIDAIAFEVGFNNRTSFYQSFKKITGLSPSDFRNNRSN